MQCKKRNILITDFTLLQLMAAKKKNLSQFIAIVILGTIIGSLFWEVVERLLGYCGVSLSLSLADPLLMDIHVFIIGMRPNIGTAFGIVGGIILFLII